VKSSVIRLCIDGNGQMVSSAVTAGIHDGLKNTWPMNVMLWRMAYLVFELFRTWVVNMRLS
jgi:hypothetical protein